MNIEEVEDTVQQTVDQLPEEFKKGMDNVGIVVDVWPTSEEMDSIQAHPGSLLFGLYTGIPRTKRLSSSYSALPDRIVIYAGPILMISKDLDDAKLRIKKTVLHEIGHHFGLSEEKIQALEMSNV